MSCILVNFVRVHKTGCKKNKRTLTPVSTNVLVLVKVCAKKRDYISSKFHEELLMLIVFT